MRGRPQRPGSRPLETTPWLFRRSTLAALIGAGWIRSSVLLGPFGVLGLLLAVLARTISVVLGNSRGTPAGTAAIVAVATIAYTAIMGWLAWESRRARQGAAEAAADDVVTMERIADALTTIAQRLPPSLH